MLLRRPRYHEPAPAHSQQRDASVSAGSSALPGRTDDLQPALAPGRLPHRHSVAHGASPCRLLNGDPACAWSSWSWRLFPVPEGRRVCSNRDPCDSSQAPSGRHGNARERPRPLLRSSACLLVFRATNMPPRWGFGGPSLRTAGLQSALVSSQAALPCRLHTGDPPRVCVSWSGDCSQSQRDAMSVAAAILVIAPKPHRGGTGMPARSPGRSSGALRVSWCSGLQTCRPAGASETRGCGRPTCSRLWVLALAQGTA